ncbi:MAG: indolepyruvate oxidoreductase subunit beta [Thermosulfidibacteraceae bacterium]|jgi:indolepyruvate ferredoxin oxidoreductase beta subunit
MKFDLVIVGVGGQGVLLASEILSEVALSKGYDVKKSEIHGMAQRGGSVFSFVRIGEKVYSPIIPLGSADLMLAFEELEALRYVQYLKPSARVILNRQRIMPITVLSGEAKYPNDVFERLIEHFEVYSIEGLALAKELKDARLTNVILLGYLASRFLPWEKNIWLKVLLERVPERFREQNLRAFEVGWNYGEG